MILKKGGKIQNEQCLFFAGKVISFFSSRIKISDTVADTKNEKGLARFARSAWIISKIA